MPIQPKQKHTPDEYLAMERESVTKSEYFNGEIFDMAGASRKHNLIVANIIAALHGQLRKRPCEVYPGDMRVKIESTGLFTYPDVTVACDNPKFDDEQKDTLLNPIIIIEVLSKSTEAYDPGKKFEQYRTIDSLADYLLVTQDRIHVEHYARRPDDSWRFSETKKPDGAIVIASIESTLSVELIYEKTGGLSL